MYNEDVARLPKNRKDLWCVLREQFEFVEQVLHRTPVETREEALANSRHRQENGSVLRAGMNAVRYRNVSNGLDSREHFLEMGRELLPYIAQALDREEWTPEFVQQWGKIMFCHGYVASYVLDDSDDLGNLRGGLRTGKLRSRDAQKKWIAHHLIPLLDAGLKRDAAEQLVTDHVRQIIDGGSYPAGFSAEWFRPIITHGGLASTYDGKHLLVETMRALVNESTDDIPPVTALVP